MGTYDQLGYAYDEAGVTYDDLVQTIYPTPVAVVLTVGDSALNVDRTLAPSPVASVTVVRTPAVVASSVLRPPPVRATLVVRTPTTSVVPPFSGLIPSSAFLGDPRYEGGTMAIHVTPDSFSVDPAGPSTSGDAPTYRGQGPKIASTDGSPASFDLESDVAWPPTTNPTYRGRSPAIHVLGDFVPTAPPGSCISSVGTWYQHLVRTVPDVLPFDRMPPSHEDTPVDIARLRLFVTGHSSAGISGAAVSFESTFDRYALLFASGGCLVPPPTAPGAYEAYGMVGAVDEGCGLVLPFRPDEYAPGGPQSGESGWEQAKLDLDGELDANEFRLSVYTALSVDYVLNSGATSVYDADARGSLVMRLELDPTHAATYTFAYRLFKTQSGGEPFYDHGVSLAQPTAFVEATYVDGTGAHTEASRTVDPTDYGVANIVAGDVVIDRSLSRGTIRFYLPGVGWYETAITKDLSGYLPVSIVARHDFERLNPGSDSTSPQSTSFILHSPQFCGTSTVPIAEEGAPADAAGTVTFRRQIGDPTTSLDAHVCMLESGAMALEWHTHGAVSVWGGELVPYCGRAPEQIALIGTSLDNVRQAWLHWGQTFDSRAGHPWADLMARLREARAVILGGRYSAMAAAYRCSSYTGGHAIILLPYFSGSDILVGDPICRNFHWVPESVLRVYGEAQGVDFYGVTSPQAVYFGVSGPWAAAP